MLGFVLICVSLFIGLSRHSVKRPPFKIAFWFWQTPFRLSAEESSGFKKLGIDTLFVRAGTFSSDGTNLVLTIPQRYESKAAGIKVHLVFNFDGGVVHHFESYNLQLISDQVAKRVNVQSARARAAGVAVAGIQFDFDCPTRLLGRYAELIDRVRARLDRKLPFSATGLMSWLGSSGVVQLSRHVDFLVPQAYEEETGRTSATMRPVSDEAYARNKIGLGERLYCPFYIGIPAYGHGFLFDESDRLLSTYRTLEPQEALRHPSFRLQSAYPSTSDGVPAKSPAEASGEEVLKFLAIRPALDGQGKGDLLGFTVPTAELLRRMLAMARALQTPNCEGAVIYRMPQEGSSLTLPYKTIEAVLEGRPTSAKLSIKVDSGIDNYERIDSGSASNQAPRELNLEIVNIGNAPSFISPDAVAIDLTMQDPGTEDVQLRDMDGLLLSRPSESTRGVTLTKNFLMPGEKAFTGPIRLQASHSQRIHVAWKVRQADGFGSTSGASDIELR